jgi:DNA-binding Xre family transcriptional regulator
VSINKTIAKNIQKYRKVSIAKLADKAGMSQFSIQNILYGKKADVRVGTLIKIAKALNVSLDKLVK